MPSITRVTCGDSYTPAATLANVWTAAGGWLTVATNSAILQLQYGHNGDDLWTDEQQLDPGAFATLPAMYCTGVRFRNAVAGQNAVVGVTFAQGGAALGPKVRPVEPILAVSALGAVITVPSTSATVITSGRVTGTHGTPTALHASLAVVSVSVKALATNTGLVYVGSVAVTTATGYQLSAGDAVAFDLSNLALVAFDVDTNGEGVTYLAVG